MEQTKSELEHEYRTKSEKVIQLDLKLRIVNGIVLSLVGVGMMLWMLTKLVIVVAVLISVAWFWYRIRLFRRLYKEIKDTKALIYESKQKPIVHAVFQDLLEEYKDNQLEPLYGNEFFSSWKITLGDGDFQHIDFVFTKRGHEISMDISDEGVSILFDEEAGDTCVEFGWDDDTLKTAYDVYPRITEICRRTYEEILRAEQAKHT